jgi:protein-S-isoprenylcysteine O-methyltransferase Ste14
VAVEHTEITEARTPDIKIRPPILFAAALLFGFGLDHLMPLPIVIARSDGLIHKLIPSAIVLLGFAIAIVGIRNFSRAGTPVPGNRPVRAVVTTGIHAWSRNPIYVGMVLLYVGIGVAVRSTWIIALAPVILVVLRYAVIAREETYLEQRFGTAYLNYKNRVRRWF